MPIRALTWSSPGKALERATDFYGRRALIGELLGRLSEYLDQDAVEEVRRAYLFAAKAHEGQHRISGESYIYHPLEVAQLLADIHMDSRTIIAAILHDIIEDTAMAKDQLAREFGEDVANLVDGVTKIEKIEFESPEDAEAENFRKMLLAMSQDLRVILIKLADRLHNMRTLSALRADKRVRIGKQTAEIYAPIANRLGLRSWGSQLEELSFEARYPKRFDALKKAIKRRQGNRRQMIDRITQNLDKYLTETGLSVRVSGRQKNLYSIYRKMQHKGLSFSEVEDIYGLRILADSMDDCYRVLGRVHGLYKPVPGKFKDYIAIPKVNGYRSLHTTVVTSLGEPLEVQVRTEEMHRVAEAGIAAHWMYKTDGQLDVEPQQLARQWLLELLESQEEGGTPAEFLEHLKTDLFPDQVYVFTPQGDIKKLPQGATALDFAYAVHSDIGRRTKGARINNSQVSLYQQLRSGDKIEVITGRSSQPTPEWLNYAITSKARAQIRAHLKKQRRKESIAMGRKLLQRALKTLGHSGRLKKTDRIKPLADLSVDHWDDLMADIGTGKRPAVIVARHVVDPADQLSVEHHPQKPIAIRGAERMLFNYAKCCLPIPGDDIVGLFSSGKGLVVHVDDCPNLDAHRKHPERWVPLQWDDSVSGNFRVDLRMEVEHKPGVLAAVASEVAARESNIVNITLTERDGNLALILLSIEVRDRQHLAEIMHQLRLNTALVRLTRIQG